MDLLRKSLLVAVVLLTACGTGSSLAPDEAETVYLNGKIYTVDGEHSWAEAVAVKDGKFVAVGSNADVNSWVGTATKKIDLGGKMAMPGMFDTHIHAIVGGANRLFECGFSPDLSRDQVKERVAQCAANQEKGSWIIGGSFAEEWRFLEPALSKRELDEVSPDNPVFLYSSTTNTGWMNSRALATLDITKDSKDPEGGRIERDDSGVPTGVLLDKASAGIFAALPPLNADQEREALKWTVNYLNANGITGIMESGSDRNDMVRFTELDKGGELSLWTTLHLFVDNLRETSESPEQIRKNDAERGDYNTDHVNSGFAKMFLDGVPMVKTAAFLEPYLPDEKHGSSYRGEFFYEDLDYVRDTLMRMDKKGVSVKIHTAGDAAVRKALDIIADVRKAHGNMDTQHMLSHVPHIAATDLTRFAELNVAAEVSPTLWFPSFINDANEAAVGERTNRSYSIASLVKAGALVTYGSDWLSAIQTANPWHGLEGMVTRKNPVNEKPGEMWLSEAVDLATAIEIFTINGAKSMLISDRTGSIEVGKSADMIVLDRPLFDIEPEDISDVKVLRTIFAGREVHSAAGE